MHCLNCYSLWCKTLQNWQDSKQQPEAVNLTWCCPHTGEAVRLHIMILLELDLHELHTRKFVKCDLAINLCIGRPDTVLYDV